jgi:hypothetical protein
MIKRLFVAARAAALTTIRYLYWTTDASTYDPMLKEGMRRAWLDGLTTKDPRFQRDPDSPRDVN